MKPCLMLLPYLAEVARNPSLYNFAPPEKASWLSSSEKANFTINVSSQFFNNIMCILLCVDLKFKWQNVVSNRASENI